VAPAIINVAPRPIPEELRTFSKNETNFFWEKIPAVLKEDTDDFFKLFSLYLEGVISINGFSELVLEMFEKRGAEDDMLKTLQNYASFRDQSRHEKNMLLKPLSDLDANLLKKADNVTPSYYRVPADFPLPICTGRYAAAARALTLNDRYCSSTIGTENFKFKIRNPNEEALFKNEDDMYEVDHEIIQFESCMNNLKKEQARCEDLSEDELVYGVYKPKYLSPANFATIKERYPGNVPQIMEAINKIPKNAYKVILESQINSNYDAWVNLKKESQELWKSQVESNFWKSLDHRQFFFKDQQKRLLTSKK